MNTTKPTAPVETSIDDLPNLGKKQKEFLTQFTQMVLSSGWFRDIGVDPTDETIKEYGHAIILLYPKIVFEDMLEKDYDPDKVAFLFKLPLELDLQNDPKLFYIAMGKIFRNASTQYLIGGRKSVREYSTPEPLVE